MTTRKPRNPRDQQAPQAGKVESDHNKQGEQDATQKNEGQRTPRGRNDRESQIGTNQTQARRGSVNSGVR